MDLRIDLVDTKVHSFEFLSRSSAETCGASCGPVGRCGSGIQRFLVVFSCQDLVLFLGLFLLCLHCLEIVGQWLNEILHEFAELVVRRGFLRAAVTEEGFLHSSVMAIVAAK
ncbi:unnamed protein product [Microthlaspi erraticum]|uniref:Uncharacterized protein n=1 Tax=Microthlaspi erraticum TaxID=1685480 RepID=A0A6D2ITJ5_9BRAS|nr:unnamed protein product [Microthlaspi erraticum]